MSYPAIFEGCWFSGECSKEKNFCAARESGGGEHCKPSTVKSISKAPSDFGYFAFWIGQNRKKTLRLVHEQSFLYFLDELIFTFESFGVWIWDPKPVYLLQYSCEYDTGNVLM